MRRFVAVLSAALIMIGLSAPAESAEANTTDIPYTYMLTYGEYTFVDGCLETIVSLEMDGGGDLATPKYPVNEDASVGVYDKCNNYAEHMHFYASVRGADQTGLVAWNRGMSLNTHFQGTDQVTGKTYTVWISWQANCRDDEVLERHHPGVFCLSADQSGHIAFGKWDYWVANSQLSGPGNGASVDWYA